MAYFHNTLFLLTLIAAVPLTLASCKSRENLSGLSANDGHAEAILNELDKDWEGISAVIALNPNFLDATTDRSFWRRKYRSIQPCLPDDPTCPPSKDPWIQSEVISADTSRETNQGKISPKIVSFKVALPNNTTEAVAISLTVDDIVRTTAIAHNLAAQGVSGFFDKLKVRRLSTPTGNVIGFNFLNDASDWEDGALTENDFDGNGTDNNDALGEGEATAENQKDPSNAEITSEEEISLISEGDDTSAPSSDTAPFTEGSKTTQDAGGTKKGDGGDEDFPAAKKGKVCTDGDCGIAAEVVNADQNPLDFLQGEIATAAKDLLGLSPSQVKMPLYSLRTIHEQGRNEAFVNIVRPGDVFTMIKDGEIVGSGFGIWLSKNPMPLDLYRDRLDVLVFGRVTNLDKVYKIAEALDVKNAADGVRAEGSVVASRLDNSTDPQDLMQFGGELYELTRDEIWGTIAFETFRNRKRETLFLNKNSKKRGAISIDGANVDQVLVTKRIGELRKLQANLSGALQKLQTQVGQFDPRSNKLVGNGKLQANFVPKGSVSATQEFFERFNNLDEIMTETEPVFNEVALASQISFFKNYFLGLRKQRYKDDIVVGVTGMLEVLQELKNKESDLRKSYNTAFGSLNHFGMRKKITEKAVKQFVSLHGFGAGLSTGPSMFTLFTATAGHYASNLKNKKYTYDFYSTPSMTMFPSNWTLLPDGLTQSKISLDDGYFDWMRYTQYREILKQFTGEYPPRWELDMPAGQQRGLSSSARKKLIARRKVVSEFNSKEAKVKRFLNYLNKNQNYLKIYLAFDSFQINKGRCDKEKKECLLLFATIYDPRWKSISVGKSRSLYLPSVVDKFTVMMKNLQIKNQVLEGIIKMMDALLVELENSEANK